MRPARLLGAARLAPPGPPFGRSAPLRGAVERKLILRRAFDRPAIHNINIYRSISVNLVRPARLLGAARLAPPGPPFGRSAPLRGAVERKLVLRRAFDRPAIHNINIYRSISVNLVRPARLLGAERLAPPGPPFGRSAPLRGAVERKLVLCRAFDRPAIHNINIYRSISVNLVRPARFERATFRFGVVVDHPAHVLQNTPDLVFQRLSGS